ncbi:MAG: AraC family ligand binding domain-containing protein [Flavobacteriales bacterium]|nr:AraC family ligand binding domain-containing protein [Flavobacteriales bacterium]
MVRYTKHADLEVFEGELSEHRYPWHYHACYTIIFVERGSVVYQFQDTSIRVGGSEVLVVEPFHVHRNMITEHTRYSAIFVPRVNGWSVQEQPSWPHSARLGPMSIKRQLHWCSASRKRPA